MKNVLSINVIKAIAALVFLMSVNSCILQSSPLECRIMVFNTSSPDDSYIINIANDTLTTSFGIGRDVISVAFDGKPIVADSLSLKRTLAEKSIELNREQIAQLKRLLESLYEQPEIDEYEQSWEWDGWGIIISYRHKQYRMFESPIRPKYEYPGELISLIEKLSPYKLYIRERAIENTTNAYEAKKD